MSASTAAAEQPTPVGLLDAVRASRREQMAEQVRELKLIIEWCAAHEVSEQDAARYVEFGRETGLTLAGVGAPCVSEFSVVELAAALGMSADAGKRYVGRVLEVRYRLPRFWEEVTAGRLEWWRAARVADHTLCLPKTGAQYVDRRLASTAAKVTLGQIDRLTTEALALCDPEAAEEKRRQAMESRHVDVHLKDVGPDGVVAITAAAELADALDFETAIATEAADLKALGCEESLDVRRSLALGSIARRQTTLDLNAGDPKGAVKPRQAVIHVHTFDPDTARCATTRTPISVDQVRGWCTNPDAQVVIKPVVDLNDHIHVDRSEVPARIKTQAQERDVTCVFPFCSRPAVSCDGDHVIPLSRGGPTCSCNLAPTCRGHHRAKTHGGWTNFALEAGRYLWRSPNGLWYHRGPGGTRDLGHLGPPTPPR